MEQGDYVWYNDFVYTVQNVSGDRALIREVNYTVTLRDLDTWVPNQVSNWTPSNAIITLQTNGVNNGSQTKLNLAAGSNITITDNGSGTDTIAATVPTVPKSFSPLKRWGLIVYNETSTTAQLEGIGSITTPNFGTVTDTAVNGVVILPIPSNYLS